MAYSTLADIKKLIPEDVSIQLTDDEGSGTVNQTRVDEAIAQADGEINGYLAGRYTVPLSTVPALIRKFSVDIAIYNLYSRKTEDMPKTRVDRYNNAIRTLEAIAKGTISLGVSPDPGDEMQIKTSTSEDDRKFSQGKSSEGTTGTLDNY